MKPKRRLVATFVHNGKRYPLSMRAAILKEEVAKIVYTVLQKKFDGGIESPKEND
jgi:hypothetical protein